MGAQGLVGVHTRGCREVMGCVWEGGHTWGCTRVNTEGLGEHGGGAGTGAGVHMWVRSGCGCRDTCGGGRGMGVGSDLGTCRGVGLWGHAGWGAG